MHIVILSAEDGSIQNSFNMGSSYGTIGGGQGLIYDTVSSIDYIYLAYRASDTNWAHLKFQVGTTFPITPIYFLKSTNSNDNYANAMVMDTSKSTVYLGGRLSHSGNGYPHFASIDSTSGSLNWRVRGSV